MNITYPVGDASFGNIRRQGRAYADKTDLIYRLVIEGNFYFLSRPKRFGKSLLISTLEAYFTAQRKLFDGLAMEQLEKEWVKYSVLRMDFSLESYMEDDKCELHLNTILTKWERLYGKCEEEATFAARFAGTIGRAHAPPRPTC